jgi:membrane-associated phospholipid phosphatase
VAPDDAPRPTDATAPNRLADAVSIASDFGAVWVAVALAQVLTRRATPLGAARRLSIAGVVSLTLTRALKHRYGVPRTDAATSTIARTPSSERFPSGHTLAAFTAALTIPRGHAGRTVALVFAALVAWARVRVGHHHAIDVVAGAAVGALAGSVLATVLDAASAP